MKSGIGGNVQPGHGVERSALGAAQLWFSTDRDVRILIICPTGACFPSGLTTLVCSRRTIS